MQKYVVCKRETHENFEPENYVNELKIGPLYRGMFYFFINRKGIGKHVMAF